MDALRDQLKSDPMFVSKLTFEEKRKLDRETVLACIIYSNSSIPLFPLRTGDDKEMIILELQLGRYTVMNRASYRLRDDKEVAIEIIRSPFFFVEFSHVSQRIKQDIDIQRLIISRHQESIQWLLSEQREETMKTQCIRQFLLEYGLSEGQYRKNSEEIENLLTTRHSTRYTEQYPGDILLCANEDQAMIVRLALTHIDFQHLPETFRYNREFVKSLIRRFGEYYRLLPLSMMKDKEITQIAVYSLPQINIGRIPLFGDTTFIIKLIENAPSNIFPLFPLKYRNKLEYLFVAVERFPINRFLVSPEISVNDARNFCKRFPEYSHDSIPTNLLWKFQNERKKSAASIHSNET